MAMTMHLNIVSAEEEIFSGTVESVFVPLLSGEVGIYPRHTPLIGEIKPGEIVVRSDEGENEQHFFVSGGILEVQPHVAIRQFAPKILMNLSRLKPSDRQKKQWPVRKPIWNSLLHRLNLLKLLRN